MDERTSPASPADQDELLVEPLTRLCAELDAFCQRADPILTRLDHLCEQLPRFLRRVVTPW
ncbi:MAG TPA: hypothetical protein VGL23_22475 [Chloroflexota bacterium]